MARKQVEDAVTAIMQEQEVMSNDEILRWTTRKPGRRFEEILDSIRDSLSDHARSNTEEDTVFVEDNDKIHSSAS